MTELLEDAFRRYQAATAAVHDHLDAAAHAAAARDLRQARVDLCCALELSGWEPPQSVRAQVLHDRNQLAEGSAVA